METPLRYPVPVTPIETPPRRRRWLIPVALGLVVVLIAVLLAVGRARDRRGTEGGTADLAGLSAELEAVRELRFKDPVRAEYLTSEELADEVREAVASEDLVTGLPDAVVLDALGIIESPEDLRPILTEASASGVIGFYDPETKRLVVESSSGDDLSPLVQTTLVHELTHAMADQHFDLGTFLTGEEPADELAARTSVAEGDATLAMNRWQAEYLSFSDQIEVGFESVGDAFDNLGSLQSLETAPPALSEIMLSPYLDGLAFIQALYDEGGWAAVNAAYRNPPLTTEQVLHPEVYRAEDTGEAVAPPEPPEGGIQDATGQIGELFLRALLAPEGWVSLLGPNPAAADAAAGWDGGAYAVTRDGGDTIVTLDVRWDTAEDADEFEAALLTSVAADPAASGWACLRVERPETTQTLVRVHRTTCPPG